MFKIYILMSPDYLSVDSESDEDDDNITVTVPTAHQQSRGATFRDSRLRRVPSHGVEQYSQSSKSQQEESESYEEESNSMSRPSRDSQRSSQSHYEQAPQGISSLAGNEDKNLYHSSSPMDYQHQQPQIYNSGMMPQMPQHSMYPQGPYHSQQPYYPQNQIRLVASFTRAPWSLLK
jgi:hypothetical protein